MTDVAVVIPNYNGMKYLKACLDSLRRQTLQGFSIILVDNGSDDGGADFVEANYPEVTLRRFETNRGFCAAVNEGIRMSEAPYVILLNNDTVCEPTFAEALLCAIKEKPKCFSCAAKMVRMDAPELIDAAGDYYCALGWAFARGKGEREDRYRTRCEIFSACAGAAIYRRSVFDEIGLFDEAHFAYLEDVDVAYRARIAGYHNYYIPEAVVRHVGSATSGSLYNEFKTRYSSRNSIYLVYKNMPWPQIVLNLPFLTVGFAAKLVFFAHRGYGREYVAGLGKGFRLCSRDKKVGFRRRNLPHYLKIQWELWINMFRRLMLFRGEKH